MMDAQTRLEILRIVAAHEPERPALELMTLADSLGAWIETRQFPEQAIGDCKADHRRA
jgi:hypothetical protein